MEYKVGDTVSQARTVLEHGKIMLKIDDKYLIKFNDGGQAMAEAKDLTPVHPSYVTIKNELL